MRSTSAETLELLKRYESQNITFTDTDGTWPIVWERAKGMHVWDADGRRYVDWTAAFGVASSGHANARVVRAARTQMSRLLHAMGDVHPHRLKAELVRELSRITFERWSADDFGVWKSQEGKCILCNSGFEAVEAALKTAHLASGKSGVIAFEGAYHGLGYGALTATHREHFRGRFSRQLGQFVTFVPFPNEPTHIEDVVAIIESHLCEGTIGAVLLEPIQARGGINVTAPGFLRSLRDMCDRYAAVLIFDEIYSGFGRTGAWFACEHERVAPDIICLGKALTGGFPMSACVGRAELMDAAWPRTTGEAIHTSTFLGHPVGCAMALAQIHEIESKDLVRKSGETGALLKSQLARLQFPSGFKVSMRGMGLMLGMHWRFLDGTPASQTVWRLIKAMLKLGHILLPEGEDGSVLAFTPPLIATARQIRALADQLTRAIDETC